jgi:hypothetical protein
MARYKCSKCGEEGWSKCQWQRSFFSENKEADVLTWLMKYDIKRSEKLTTVVLEFPRAILENETMTDAELLMEAFDLVRTRSNEVLKSYVCDHRYELLSEKCDLGCCARKEDA